MHPNSVKEFQWTYNSKKNDTVIWGYNCNYNQKKKTGAITRQAGGIM